MRLLPLMLLVVCCSASAEWLPFLKLVDGKQLFVDWATLQKNKEMRRIWVLENQAESDDRLQSTTTFVEINCSEKKFKVLQQYWYAEQMGRGKNITPEFEKLDWSFPAPGTGMYIILISVCK